MVRWLHWAIAKLARELCLTVTTLADRAHYVRGDVRHGSAILLLARLKDGGSGGPCLPPASQSAIFAWLALAALERIFAFGVLAFFS
jgi:hypothetical protein